MDSAGRLVIPKAVREKAGLSPSTPLDVRFHDGRVEIEPAPVEVRVEIEPAPVEVRVEMRRGVAVAVPDRPVPTLSAARVEEVRRSIRSEREERAEGSE